MKRIIKAISILLAATVLMASLCVTASASLADDLKKAKVIDSGSKISFRIKDSETGKWKTRYYKIEMAKKGTLKIDYTLNCNEIDVQLIKGDRSGYIEPTSREATVGWTYYSDLFGSDNHIELTWSSSLENGKGTFSYELDKGTYYIKIFKENGTLTELGKSSFKFTYPQAKDEEESEGKITGLSLTMEKGDKLQLGALIDGEGTAKWSASKKSVATVSSKGVVTAKSKGEATITAKLGSSSFKIKIIVK